MGRERRIFERFPLNIEGALFLCRGRNGEKFCGPVSCRLHDLSKKGAGLVTTRIIIDNHHLFFAALESDTIILHIEFALPGAEEGSGTEITIPVRPVWFDRLIDEEQKPFKMGIEFFERLNDQQFQRIRQLGR